MKIEILGTNCSKCITLENNAKLALSQIGGFYQLEKVDDLAKIMEYGVLSTPALVVDEKVISSGKVLSVEEIKEILTKSKVIK